MKGSGLLDTRGELLIQRYGDGIKLVHPDYVDAIARATLCSISKIFAMPFNVYFLNAKHIIQNLNKNSITNYGFASWRVARGKRLVDKFAQPKITLEFPWYDDNDQIVGVLGCSIVIHEENIYSLGQALSLLTQTGLFQQPISSNIQTQEYYFTEREKDVLYHLALGQTAKEIARRLALSHRTVEKHLCNLKLKVGVDSKAALTEKVVHLINKHSATLPSTDVVH
jgi:DNA-binding CsgD family transcriptional regulator